MMGKPTAFYSVAKIWFSVFFFAPLLNWVNFFIGWMYGFKVPNA